MRNIALLATAVSFAWTVPARADIIYGPRAGDVIVATSGDEVTTGPHAIGFNFPFFGSNQTEVLMNSKGNLSFGSGFTFFTNSGLPQPVPPYPATPIIAPFWEDLFLDPGSGMRINTTVAGEFVALWHNIGYFSPIGPRTNFEAILLGAGNSFGLTNGSILFSYGTNAHAGSSATAGITNGVSLSATLADVIGSNANGTLTGPQALSLQGRSFLFTPGGPSTAPTYVVTEYVRTTPLPAPSALVLIGIGAIALASWRRVRRTGEPALAV